MRTVDSVSTNGEGEKILKSSYIFDVIFVFPLSLGERNIRKTFTIKDCVKSSLSLFFFSVKTFI